MPSIQAHPLSLALDYCIYLTGCRGQREIWPYPRDTLGPSRKKGPLMESCSLHSVNLCREFCLWRSLKKYKRSQMEVRVSTKHIQIWHHLQVLEKTAPPVCNWSDCRCWGRKTSYIWMQCGIFGQFILQIHIFWCFVKAHLHFYVLCFISLLCLIYVPWQESATHICSSPA